MQTFESFIQKHPRFKLRSHLDRRGIKTVDQAVKHFQTMNVQIETQLLEAVLGISEKSVVEEQTNSRAAMLAEQSEQQCDGDAEHKDAEIESTSAPKTRPTRRKKAVENNE